MALFLVLSVSTGAYAAETGKLSIKAANVGGENVVEVSLMAEGATNGKVVVGYDADLVALAECEVGDIDWVYSVNAEEPGVISLAWAGSEMTAEKTCLLTLTFSVVVEEAAVATYSAEIVELYDSGEAMSAGSPVESNIWINGGGTIVPDVPVTPPTEPEVPVEPSEGEDPEQPGETDEPLEVEVPFTDIDHWAAEYIKTAYAAGLIKGTSETTFSPETNITRGSFITLLYRLSGSPEVTGENPFTDVVEGEYYANAVIWGYENGVVNGKSADTFAPNGDITRQELATMLMRYAKLTGADVDAAADLAAYADAGEIADWAMDAMKWAVAKGYISGRTTDTLAPQGITNRAEAATILVRFAGL